VPEDCVSYQGDTLQVEQGDYIRSGWGVKNMRFNAADEGQQLFPNPSRPVCDLDDRMVQNFIHRIGTVRKA
jgi:hypothetical protein